MWTLYETSPFSSEGVCGGFAALPCIRLLFRAAGYSREIYVMSATL